MAKKRSNVGSEYVEEEEEDTAELNDILRVEKLINFVKPQRIRRIGHIVRMDN